MPVPDYETLMEPVLRLFASGCANVSECLPGLRQKFDISDEEAAELLPSGRVTVLASRAHWARTYMSKAGLIHSPKRNRHELTDRGRTLLALHPDRIDNSTLEQFPEFSAWRNASRKPRIPSAPVLLGSDDAAFPTPSTTADETPEERLRAAHAEIESALADDLLQAVLQTTPARFERLVVELLIAMGYGNGDPARGKSIGKSGDGGIDGIVNEDALGLDAVYIQAKRYASDVKVGRPDLQRFVGSMSGESATKGVFVTTSAFSQHAIDYLPKIAQRVVLIDGQRLARLMIANGVGVRAEDAYVIRSIDTQFFDND